LKHSREALQAAENYHEEMVQLDNAKKEQEDIAKMTSEEVMLAQVDAAKQAQEISLAQVA